MNLLSQPAASFHKQASKRKMILSNGYFECAAPGQDARVHNVNAHLSHQSSLKLDHALSELAEGVGLLLVMPVGIFTSVKRQQFILVVFMLNLELETALQFAGMVLSLTRGFLFCCIWDKRYKLVEETYN